VRYGYFDDAGREYVIERPDTPMPWINYLGEGDYCAIVSNNAGGYSFRRSPGHGRILRYRFNAVPTDRPGRYIYLRDERGDYWSASWAPVQKPLDRQHVTCRHGLGYTAIESAYGGITSEALYLVPADAELEVWRLTLTNTGDAPRTLDVLAYAEFAMPSFAMETDLQCILYAMWTGFRDGIVSYHTNHAARAFRDAWFACVSPVESFDALREAFIGPWRDESNPLSVENGRCSGACGNGGNACGALHVRVDLAAGQTRRTAFLLGSGTAEEAGATARKTFTLDRIESELAALKRRWSARLDALTCHTPDAATNSMLNVWNAYQAHATFQWSRSASLIEAGGRDGFGYRDTLQDALAVMHTSPQRAGEVIAELLRGQASAGCALHGVQPLTLETGRGQVPEKVWSDDHLWLLPAVGAYVRETGDLAFLDRRVEYLDAGEAGVCEHARMALEYACAHRGRNGLLLGLEADWNDCINLGARGQSVWSSMLYCLALEEFTALAEAAGRSDDAAWASKAKADMVETINRHAWDGRWYLRAILEDGTKVGSAQNREGAIFLNTQSWAVISGIADGDRARTAMDAAHDRLATEHGLCLFAPPYTEVSGRIGGATFYPPGQKENASIFCHANTWAMIAEAMLGRGERAFAYYRALLPSVMNDRAELRQVEPYVYCQFVKGPSDAGFGQGRNPWLTGTASWAYVAATQYVLGIRPGLGGLAIDPCIPGAWEGFEVRRVFRGATYHIRVRNPHGLCKGARRLTVDDQRVEGNVVPVAEPGSEVHVEVVLEPQRPEGPGSG
jgi:N,N'-diacetylchitobiose phosphorylase